MEHEEFYTLLRVNNIDPVKDWPSVIDNFSGKKRIGSWMDFGLWERKDPRDAWECVRKSKNPGPLKWIQDTVHIRGIN